TELGRMRHIGEHLNHSDQRADHTEGRRAVADRAINLLALVEVRQEDVAIALHVVANEIDVIAVGDEADSLGQKRIFDFHLFEPNGPCLRVISAKLAISSTSSRWVVRRIVKANLAPSGTP